MNIATEVKLSRLICAVLVITGLCRVVVAAEPPRERRVKFTYAGEIKLSSKGKTRVWLPVPPANDFQTVEIVDLKLPGEYRIEKEAKYGNRIIYFEQSQSSANVIEFEAVYDVVRHEVQALETPNPSTLSLVERNCYLAANVMVPIGNLSIPGIPSLASPVKAVDQSEMQTGRAIYEHVDSLVAYDKSKPGYGRGDVQWVCDSRTGNCTDFHSLFISLAREKKLPAKFEIGFPLPSERGQGAIGGYHCWAYFFTKQYGWVPVDISEADKHPELKEYYFGNLTENRINFSTGRDIDLVPKQESPSLNYFVYPHVENDGKTVERARIDMHFSFQDYDGNGS